MNELMTTQEICNYFKISRRTLFNWRSQGMPFKQNNRTIRFDLDEVKIWIENKTGKKFITIEHEETSELYQKLTKSISNQTIKFYLNINKIIKNLLCFVKENEKQELIVLLNKLEAETNKICVLGAANIELINNTIIKIFEELQNSFFTFEPAIIIKLCKMLNSQLKLNISELNNDELIRKLIHLNSSLTNFNETYEMTKTMIDTLKLYSKEGDTNVSNKKQ